MISAISVILVAEKCANGSKAKLYPAPIVVGNAILIALPDVRHMELYG
jgi:hypothetical protein